MINSQKLGSIDTNINNFKFRRRQFDVHKDKLSKIHERKTAYSFKSQSEIDLRKRILVKNKIALESIRFKKWKNVDRENQSFLSRLMEIQKRKGPFNFNHKREKYNKQMNQKRFLTDRRVNWKRTINEDNLAMAHRLINKTSSFTRSEIQKRVLKLKRYSDNLRKFRYQQGNTGILGANVIKEILPPPFRHKNSRRSSARQYQPSSTQDIGGEESLLGTPSVNFDRMPGSREMSRESLPQVPTRQELFKKYSVIPKANVKKQKRRYKSVQVKNRKKYHNRKSSTNSKNKKKGKKKIKLIRVHQK